jgi:hypothetical protein
VHLSLLCANPFLFAAIRAPTPRKTRIVRVVFDTILFGLFPELAALAATRTSVVRFLAVPVDATLRAVDADSIGLSCHTITKGLAPLKSY